MGHRLAVGDDALALHPALPALAADLQPGQAAHQIIGVGVARAVGPAVQQGAHGAVVLAALLLVGVDDALAQRVVDPPGGLQRVGGLAFLRQRPGGLQRLPLPLRQLRLGSGCRGPQDLPPGAVGLDGDRDGAGGAVGSDLTVGNARLGEQVIEGAHAVPGDAGAVRLAQQQRIELRRAEEGERPGAGLRLLLQPGAGLLRGGEEVRLRHDIGALVEDGVVVVVDVVRGDKAGPDLQLVGVGQGLVDQQLPQPLVRQIEAEAGDPQGAHMGDGGAHVRLAPADQAGVLRVADPVVVQHPGDGLGGIGIAVQHAGEVQDGEQLLVLGQPPVEGGGKDDVELVQLLQGEALDGGVKLCHVVRRGPGRGEGLGVQGLDDAVGVVAELYVDEAGLGGVVAQIAAACQTLGKVWAAQQVEGRRLLRQDPPHGDAGVPLAAALGPGGVAVRDLGEADQTALLAVLHPGLPDPGLDLQDVQKSGVLGHETGEQRRLAGERKFRCLCLLLPGEEGQQLLLGGDRALRGRRRRQGQQQNQGQQQRKQPFAHENSLLNGIRNQSENADLRRTFVFAKASKLSKNIDFPNLSTNHI